MFKYNPNVNEYYGQINTNKNKIKKLKRTQFSGQKLESSKKSFSQDSQSQLGKRIPSKNNIFNRKPQQIKGIQKIKAPLIQTKAGQNFLDQFTLQKPNKQYLIDNPIQENLKKGKKFIGIDTEDQQMSYLPRNLKYQNDFGQYFGDSGHTRNLKLQRKSSKSLSQRSKQSKSPLRKILKSKSKQQLYTPVQRMYQVLKQQEKIKQKKVENEKTLKQINFYRTMNQLNQTYLHQKSKKLNNVKSQKNIHQIQAYQLKEINNRRQLPRYDDSNFIKNQSQLQSSTNRQKQRIKKIKSQKQLLNVPQYRSKPKMSTSKIKRYFNNKQKDDKKRQTMKQIFEEIQVNNHIDEGIRKAKSLKFVPVMRVNFDDQSKVSDSVASHSQNSYKQQLYTPGKKNRQEESELRSSPSYLEYSDYGFQHHQGRQIPKNQKRFLKTPKSTNKKLQQPDSPSGQLIDSIQSFESSKFNDKVKQGSAMQQFQSVASIEEKLSSNSRSQKSSKIQSQKYLNSNDCVINIKSPQKSNLTQKQSIKTPVYRNNNKKPKQSIISKLKKDIQQDKLKSSIKSKLSSSKVLKRESSYSKVQSSAISKRKIQTYKKNKKQQNDYQQNLQYLKAQKSKSNIEGLSDLIHISLSTDNLDNDQLRTDSKIKNGKELSKQSQQNHSQQIDSRESLSSVNTENVNSMINSNPSEKYKKSSSNIKINYEIVQKVEKDENKQKQQKSPQKNEVKNPIKFVKIKKPQLAPVSIPKMQESNIDSMTQSNQTFSQSMNSSQTSPLKSSKSLSQSKKIIKDSVKVPSAKQPQHSIKQEQISEYESESNSSSQSSINITSNASQNKKSLKKHQSDSIKQKSSQSSMNQPSNSIAYNKTSKISSTQNNLKINSKSSFSNTNSNILNSKAVDNSSRKFNKTLKIDESGQFRKKKNFAQYTLNDVARYIEEHQFRIEAFCLYIDNCKQVYEQDYELQKMELLSFLMLKKNLFQLHRTIRALQGKGENVFTLTDIQILDEVLQDYLDRQQIQNQLSNLVKQEKNTCQQFQAMYKSLQKKYTGEKGFNNSLQKDDFSRQIVKKLGQQLNVLYEKWQRNKSDGDKVVLNIQSQKYQKRMIQIIELIFLTTQLDGRKIKTCELVSQTDPQFRSYYEKWFEIIIQVLQYFDSKSNNYSSSS